MPIMENRTVFSKKLKLQLTFLQLDLCQYEDIHTLGEIKRRVHTGTNS